MTVYIRGYENSLWLKIQAFFPVKTRPKQFFFLFTTLFGAKGQLDRFRFLSNTWQQRESIVAWSGGDEIACLKRDGI